MIETRWTIVSTPAVAGAQRRGIGDVALDELRAPRGRARAVARVAHEHAHRQLARAQRMHDVRPDEARAAGDEDHSPASKFLK